jgi:GNAT superfamily N-acetyltransferase
MIMATDDDLYVRGAATLLASWDEYARGSPGAALRRMDGVAAAVFPNGPERSVYNNALLERALGPGAREAAVEEMEAAYRSAGVDRYAGWVHESDDGMRAEMNGRGYTIEESTLVMGMPLNDLPDPPAGAGFEVGPLTDWSEYLEYLVAVEVPEGLLAGADPSAFHTLVARMDGENVGTAIAFDFDGDCGIYNMSTVETARRRGIGRALTDRHLRDAAHRGCSTATLQATPMAERVYASAGFRALGRFLEFSRASASARA